MLISFHYPAHGQRSVLICLCMMETSLICYPFDLYMGMLKLAWKWKKTPKQGHQIWENQSENPFDISLNKIKKQNAVLPTQQPLSEVRETLSISNIEAQVLHLKVFGVVVTMEEN